MVILSIPILDITSKFSLYHVINVPVPFPHTNLTAQLQLSHDKFAISHDKTKIVFMADFEYTKCSLTDLQFCSLNSPLYPVSLFEHECLIQMFFHLTVSENTNQCLTQIIVNNDHRVKVYHVIDGTWLITSHNVMTFHMTCPDSPVKRHLIHPPLAVLSLKPGCSASSSHVFIPPTYFQSSRFWLTAPHFLAPSNFSLWHEHSTVIHEALLKIPHQLPHIANESQTMTQLVTRLQKNLNSISTISQTSSQGVQWYIYVIIVLVILFILIIIFLIYYYKVRSMSGLIQFLRQKKTKVPQTQPISMSSLTEATPPSVPLSRNEPSTVDLTTSTSYLVEEEPPKTTSDSLSSSPKRVLY